jgi:hypothetical protein
MWARGLNPRQYIPEGIDFVTPPEGRGFDGDHVFQALLERRRTWDKMQQVMGVQHIAAILVCSFVLNAVAPARAHIRTDCESPVCEK